MRVFVAGATGVIGRRAVRALIAAGHEVTAAVRSPAKAALARSLGATPVEVDLFLAPNSDQMLAMARSARRGVSVYPGNADGFLPSIHADDAASAVVAALTAPAGTYDVVDDEPLRRGEQRAALGSAVGRRRL